eukprot:PhM_4_TR803/c0_g1_i1/m.55134
MEFLYQLCLAALPSLQQQNDVKLLPPQSLTTTQEIRDMVTLIHHHHLSPSSSPPPPWCVVLFSLPCEITDLFACPNDCNNLLRYDGDAYTTHLQLLVHVVLWCNLVESHAMMTNRDRDGCNPHRHHRQLVQHFHGQLLHNDPDDAMILSHFERMTREVVDGRNAILRLVEDADRRSRIHAASPSYLCSLKGWRDGRVQRAEIARVRSDVVVPLRETAKQLRGEVEDLIDSISETLRREHDIQMGFGV